MSTTKNILNRLRCAKTLRCGVVANSEHEAERIRTVAQLHSLPQPRITMRILSDEDERM